MRPIIKEYMDKTDHHCPVSGWPITSKPEWLNIDLGEEYFVSFKLIGKKILLSSLSGNSGRNGINRFFEERKKILKSSDLLGKQFIELKDYSQAVSLATKEERQQFIKHMKLERNQGNLMGYFGYNASLSIKLGFSVGKRLHRATFPMQIVGSYKSAMEKAMELMKKLGLSDQPKRFARDDWFLEFQDYRVNFEVIGDDIIYNRTQGILRESHVKPFFKLYGKILDESGIISKGYHFRITNWEKMERSDWSARPLYIKNLNRLNKKFPCRLTIGFGLNLFMKTIINTSRIFLPFPIAIADNLENAIDIIEKEKAKKVNIDHMAKKNKPKFFQGNKNLNNQINNLLAFMGKINWDTNGLELVKNQNNISTDFLPLYQSFSLIKQDFDSILYEKTKAEKKILESSKYLEIMNVKLERAIKRSNQMVAESAMAYLELEQIFRASTEGLWVVSSSFAILRVNKMFLSIIGKTNEELKGKKCYEVFPTRLCHSPECPVTRIVDDASPHIELDLEKQTKGKEFTPFILSAFPFRDVENEIIGVVIGLKDITERKNAEILQAEKIKAEAENLAKSNFLSNISHEMRTPLNGVIGMTELIQNTELDENQRDIFDTIVNEAKALIGIINNVLDFSKIEAGKFDLENIPFKLRHLIEDISNSIAVRAHQKKLELTSFISPDIPYWLHSDPGRLRQILMNLAGNALKFTHKGEIFITAQEEKDLGNKVAIRFSVKDTGIGIPKDKQKAIFNSFTQADGSITREYGGTGLGTAISKQLVELMGGNIGFTSEEGKGSTFFFTIDLLKQKNLKIDLEIKKVDLDNLKILVVTQNKNIRFVHMEYLKTWGCNPVSARYGKEALSILKKSISVQEPVDLILTDSLLPDVTGFELAEQIRKIEKLKKIPIILMTSVGWIGDSKLCKDIDINGYLTKPVKQDDLQKIIKIVLGLSTEEEIKNSFPLVTRHTLAETLRNTIQILLAEDYPTNQQVALSYLNEAGYQVDLAENGQETVDMYKLKHYDIILMDIQMPVMGGFEATKIIRSLGDPKTNGENITPHLQTIPIIAMTAHAMGGYRALCLDAGMDDYISKPLLKKDLFAMLDKWTLKNGHPKPLDREIPTTQNLAGEAVILAGDGNKPMDYDRALEEFMGKKEILAKVLDVFLENARNQIKVLGQAINDKDLEIVKKEAHTLKGGAANLTAQGLSRIASELEDMGKSGKPQGMDKVLEKFEKEFMRLEIFLKDNHTGIEL
jgi:PAS domain S-box-containing protein